MSYATQTILIAVDRSLTEEQMDAAASLSSRAVVTHRSARYAYHFGGSFRGNEQELLTTGGFDAFLWVDSIGASRLVFRIPADLISWQDLERYLPDSEYPPIELEAPLVGTDRLLSFHFHNEDGEGGWLEENNGDLEALLPLRAALMAGDYRCLYLAWLKNKAELREENEEEGREAETTGEDEPPVPPGLGEATPALTAFCHRFYVYEDLIDAAAEDSAPMPETDYESLVEHLSPEQKNDFLRAFLAEDPAAVARLRRVLEGLS